MGVGMVLIVEPKTVNNIIAQLAKLNLKSWVIGEITKGKKQVEIL